jgi:hypothetical protein
VPGAEGENSCASYTSLNDLRDTEEEPAVFYQAMGKDIPKLSLDNGTIFPPRREDEFQFVGNNDWRIPGEILGKRFSFLAVADH